MLSTNNSIVGAAACLGVLFLFVNCTQNSESPEPVKAITEEMLSLSKSHAEFVMKPIKEGIEKKRELELREVPPKSKEICLKETGGEVNEWYAKCRRGYKVMEEIRNDSNH